MTTAAAFRSRQQVASMNIQSPVIGGFSSHGTVT
jgi:hypothetical protein